MKNEITQREARELDRFRTLSKKLQEQLECLVICTDEIVNEHIKGLTTQERP